jgi:hypothetical protein
MAEAIVERAAVASRTLNVLMVLPVNRGSSASIIACSSFAMPIPSVQGKARDAPTAYVGFLLAQVGVEAEVELVPQGKVGDADLRTLVA